jgi:hypothetical protein
MKIPEGRVTGFHTVVAFGLLAAASFAGAAQAQTPEEFYKGRTMRMLIPAAVGDSYDTEGRLIARHLSRFIPAIPPSWRKTCRAPRDAT